MENQFEHTTLPLTSVMSGHGTDLVPDVCYLTIQIANLCFVGDPEKERGWVLVDAGMPNSAEPILETARTRFGADNPPTAIVLTHGHFDHVGAIVELVEHWHVPVYVHLEEIPYLTGKRNYPAGDPAAGGGLVSLLSPVYQQINITDWLYWNLQRELMEKFGLRNRMYCFDYLNLICDWGLAVSLALYRC